MDTRVKYDKLFKNSSVWIATAVRIILNILLIIIIGALVIGVLKSGIDLVNSINEPLHKILQTMLLDTIFIIALVELTLTLLGYLKDGHVHVRYIIDTVLIIMLNEMVTLWFAGATIEKVVGISILVGTLAVLRFAAIRFAPDFIKAKKDTGTENRQSSS